MAIAVEPRSRANENKTEASRIPEPKPKPTAETKAQVLVTLGKLFLGTNRQPAAHPEMNDEHIASSEIDQKIFRPPSDSIHTTTNASPLELASCHPLSKPGALNSHILDKASNQVGTEARRQHLDFRQFGHSGIVAARAQKGGYKPLA